MHSILSNAANRRSILNHAPNTTITMMPLSALRSLLRSKALRASAALGMSGLALACGNLLLARILPSAEFALFALIYALAQIGFSIGPVGADVILARRKFAPDAKLHTQVLCTSAATGALVAAVSALMYPLRLQLLAALFMSIIAGSVRTVAVAYYRSHERFGSALILTMSTNASVLAASIIAFMAHANSALLPAVAMCVGMCLAAVIGWRAVSMARSTGSAVTGYSWPEGWSAVSFASAGMVLAAMERLVTPQLLGLGELATFSVLATIAGSPFQMLQLGVGYTLLPALRNTPDSALRRRAFKHEALVVTATCLAAATAVLVVTPLVLTGVLAGRYQIGMPLTLAAIASGVLKVLASLFAAVVTALGSRADLFRLSVVGWISIAIALLGGAVGARWGLIGLVFGVALGWMFRALAIGVLAMPHLAGKPGHVG
jgi:O-antigen/teichoic acid export membrane protein